MSPDAQLVAAVNQDSNSVSLWPWQQSSEVREIHVGQEPRTLAFSSDGRHLIVTCQRSQTLVIVDVQQQRVASTIQLSGQPYGVVITADDRFALVSQYAGGYVDGTYRPGIVTMVDLSTGEIENRISAKARPWAMALDETQTTLYVTHYLHIDGEGLVTEIDLERSAVRRHIAFAEDDDVVGGQGGFFNALAAITIHPNGRRAVVAGMHANVRRGTVLSGRALSHKTTVQAALRVIDLQEATELYDARIVSSFSGQAVAVPVAVEFIADGPHFIDLYFASNDLKVLKYNELGLVSERALLELPAGPTGIAVTADGRTAFVNCRWDRSIARLSLADIRAPHVVTTVRKTDEPWSDECLNGAKLFHNTRDTRMTANRWVSCAVCHLDGGLVSDASMWDLTVPGKTPKVSNTTDLVAIARTSPPFFHRGTPDVVFALERFVQIFHRGSGFLNPDAKLGVNTGNISTDWDEPPSELTKPSEPWQAMLTFMNRLQPRPNPHMLNDMPHPDILESARRGRDLFFDDKVGCARCHAGECWTISGSGQRPSVMDVGTGKAVDVPPLLHLWDTAPYLHDGQAATLLDVLTTCNTRNRHGHTSHLNRQQLDDLTSFLLAPFDPISRRQP